MNLYEWEGKTLLRRAGIQVPRSVRIARGDDPCAAYRSLSVRDAVVKAQTLSGKRGRAGGVVMVKSEEETLGEVTRLFSEPLAGQYVDQILLEEKVDYESEAYLSISYDAAIGSPVLLYGADGGMSVEEEAHIHRYVLSTEANQFPEHVPLARELWDVFTKNDARVVEINPLFLCPNGSVIAGDAKIALDDDAFFRHDEWSEYATRSMLGRLPTEREIEAAKIDTGDGYYRGTAGKYIEFDGDVAVLFSGGGASIACMDAMIAHGLMPANYTEYSGNPPREKVAALARIVLSKPGLRGLWICGGVANFTNIKETFLGIIDALEEVKPTYPIVVRRAGPHADDGFELMKRCATEFTLDLTLLSKDVSMTGSARMLAERIHSRV